MAFAEIYHKQVALLLRALPHIAEEDCFALKGGTAINLFVRDLPRLSVDIDLAYVPVEPRDRSLAAIDGAMKRIAEKIRKAIGAHVTESIKENAVIKLVVRAEGVQIIVEVTPVLRGCVFEPEVRAVSPKVEELFGFAEIRVVSFADLYAGKLVAALDRQHPRDLFDVRELLAQEGVDDALRKAFIVYLLSHDRPMFEVLASPQKEFSQEFVRGFQGMTDTSVQFEDLVLAREAMIDVVVNQMPMDHRRFLISFEKGQPDWELLGIPEAAGLPAVRWRQQNLDKLEKTKREELVVNLEKVLLKN
jgi:predicted nucleotidyltransferase component of viral defense system